MKLVYSFLAILLVSGTAMACPNLTGEWICSDSKGEKMKTVLNSINKEDVSLLMIKSDVGTKVETSNTLILDVGRQKSQDYNYNASCRGNSVVLNLETAFGNAKVVYTLLSHNNMLVSSSVDGESNDRVMTCKTLSLLD